MMKLFSLAPFMMLFLSGCNSTNEQLVYADCIAEDWKKLGYEAAQSGKNVRTFDNVKRECGSKLAPEAQELFVDGYSDGLLEYCTYELGHGHGEQGLEASDICPLDMSLEYKKGYRVGLRKRTELEEYMARQKRELEMGIRSQGQRGMRGDK
ncbi:DUF2799 domain-containing protein [Pseudoalteromonas luteoviolacea]|uniref:DUF2799 domain-containing protein n=1 Tax=Pseudoalteromonas luteoviolacea DSM 6061 TaxID=1365250 RepID=A0A166V6H1_9GAMM|nr:DUF2799 domain-containing protein [Pseudoalteromonas luteoviolacea]KZN31773.1 hypothetical protein N475_04760 [Pseudoalteromonas luteoviolacea DSM 6061]KZN54633.1 hypothetical protein N474_02580 [Pseudoalteromonas luteoviolacea CPMOR-2]MBE0389110.1 hypothetical protein [Pseudoalteromonas luteoviolacea DSM 6061]TQF70510.1 DUF2799 domain-containing protein [Pseudoalteromonas luteoviolacea]